MLLINSLEFGFDKGFQATVPHVGC